VCVCVVCVVCVCVCCVLCVCVCVYEISGMGAGGLGQQGVEVERGLGRSGEDARGREARHVVGAVPRRPCSGLSQVN
jgi:hypothetical protein